MKNTICKPVTLIASLLLCYGCVCGHCVLQRETVAVDSRRPLVEDYWFYLEHGEKVKHGAYLLIEQGTKGRFIVRSGSFVHGKKSGLWFHSFADAVTYLEFYENGEIRTMTVLNRKNETVSSMLCRDGTAYSGTYWNYETRGSPHGSEIEYCDLLTVCDGKLIGTVECDTDGHPLPTSHPPE